MPIALQNRTIFTGDNLEALRNFPDAGVDLIYLDPPFNTRKQQRTDQYAYEDQWNMHDLDEDEYSRFAEYYPKLHHVAEAARYAQDSHTKAYLVMMALRLRELYRVLKPTGSVYLHCDPKASHYLKIVMDVIFGMDNFRNEIVWSYRTGGASKKRFSQKHDVILLYRKTQDCIFNPLPEKAYTKSKSRKPGIVNYGGGTAEFYEDDGGVYNLVNMRDVWDIPYIGSTDAERLNYPTQKPLALLERIINASSNPGELVLDPFCGCATACVAAERLGRQWIGIDQVEDAYDLMVNRLVTRGEASDQTNLLFSGKGLSATDLIRNLDPQGKAIAHDKIKTMKQIKTHQETIKKSRKTTHARPSRSDDEIIPLGQISDAIPVYREDKNKSRLYGQQRGHCNGCGDQVRYDWMQIDHVTPKAKGGASNIGNYQLLCPSCNQLKGTGTQEALIAKLKLRNRYER